MHSRYCSHFLPFFALTALLAAIPSHAVRAADPVEYAYPDQSVWTIRRDADGMLRNPLLGLARELFTRAELDWYATPYPAKRMFRRLSEGDSMFSMLVRAPALQKCCLFSQQPVTSTELRVYRRNGVPAISSYQELAGKQVVALLGYSYGKIGRFIRDKANRVALSETARHHNAFMMLQRGRADYVLDYAGPSEEVLAAIPIPDVDYDVLTRLDVHLVLSKSYPDARLLMERLEQIAGKLDIERILAQ